MSGRVVWDVQTRAEGKRLYVRYNCTDANIVSNIYNMSGRVVSDIYKHEPKASGCISDTTRTRMLYIAYDTPTSKCSCLSTNIED